ncbi:50S ribosomal protein L21 [Candidatus Portiera aleyrodidarum]|uniref:Large ribosomal subunit protein bL21 n=1 Tax=Candidatus Portiera aleyrodidarum MED (Bemisia tabaci) TaxID=1163752 RepID=A0AAU8RR68_9GAMM|nr:50S ribosomal protein L21 [Candidatus Portiera aleyrodidarum]AFQ24071.1 LSU ribosomal protein L21P [Candidatus Portiera aleyrodidarum BT-B-HRs]AFS18835.1 50S ribosomal protein L21 [Candidatus Portiera aleyrodidarum BT-QVLC]AFT80461.1 ribosomal protein L21 [Candidatus Portiera aleyrodidarum BT-QVLC]AFT80742.1 ribosomal protein L21 [Candidatus Portiera aleyrodidarum BT-B-HRs]AJF24048.1 50S ribosomal protein L21 [Candidatus Portiera aleyrodidarum MED (Bemisia tabaci)]
MYAVIKCGNKQFYVKEGQKIKIDKVKLEIGDVIVITKVLLINKKNKIIKIGRPFVKTATVSAEIIAHKREKKIKIIHFKRRKHYMRHKGHRQWFSEIKIINIKGY